MNFIRPNFFRTITKLFSRYFERKLKKIGRVSTKRKCNIKLFHCTGFFALLEKRFSLMKYRKIFLLRLFRALYQGTDKILDFPNCMVREQELLGRIDKVCTLVEQRERFIKKRMKTYVTQVDSGCQVNTYVWKPMSDRWKVGVRLKRTQFHYFFRVKRVTQLALQEVNLISQFNFSLVLPDIITNKTLEESALPGTVFSYVSKPFASTPCLGECFRFSILLMICFTFMPLHGKRNLFPRSRSEFQVRPVADGCF